MMVNCFYGNLKCNQKTETQPSVIGEYYESYSMAHRCILNTPFNYLWFQMKLIELNCLCIFRLVNWGLFTTWHFIELAHKLLLLK